MWYIFTMEFYSAIRKNDTTWFEGKWLQLKDIMLSEVSQVQEDKGCIFSLICGRQIQKINVYPILFTKMELKTQKEALAPPKAKAKAKALKAKKAVLKGVCSHNAVPRHCSSRGSPNTLGRVPPRETSLITMPSS
jgi:hypothetical protein